MDSFTMVTNQSSCPLCNGISQFHDFSSFLTVIQHVVFTGLSCPKCSFTSLDLNVYYQHLLSHETQLPTTNGIKTEDNHVENSDVNDVTCSVKDISLPDELDQLLNDFNEIVDRDKTALEEAIPNTTLVTDVPNAM